MSSGSQRRPIAVDLFCGAGGMSVGFEQAGFDVMLAVDRDAHHVATHHRNFPYGQSLMASVAELSGEDIRRLLGCQDVDLVYGGPPCQGFSNMGLRDSNDPRNSLVDHFCRVVGELRPRAFVMENVPGMNSGDTVPYFELAIKRLRTSGYRIAWPVQTLNAVDFGVPQHRQRLFILGVRDDVSPSAPQYPDPRTGTITVADAFDGLPSLEEHSQLFKTDGIPYPSVEPTRAYARFARGLDRPTDDYSRPREWPSHICTGCLRTKHAPKTTELYLSTPVGSMVPGHKLPRLDPAGISPTLRAGTDSERGSHTAPRPVHPEKPRVISVREAARLHGYPDWFSFFPKKWHAYRQIGNSVCPPVAKAVGLQILRTLNLDPRSFERPTVKLGSRFELAEERPVTHKRIATAAECPKVIEHLWLAAKGNGREALKPEISIEAITDAIVSTKANLPRIRPDQFLAHVARYRNVEQLLSAPIAEGYSIAFDPAHGTGRFVRDGSAACMNYSDNFKVKSSEIKAARKVDCEFDLSEESTVAAIAEAPLILELLTHSSWRSLTLTRDLFGLPRRPPYLGEVLLADGTRSRAIILSSVSGRLPTKSRAAAQARAAGARHVLLLSAVTNQHLLAVVCDIDEDNCFERYRCVFHSSNTAPRNVSLVDSTPKAAFGPSLESEG